ncbi:3D domain-containing protein [Aestuariibaculum marinum]|uniref:3D domain-containing protein n=1 Tax=Aestuariibaculum marinum TaxID=2683592 RepID=UPI00293BD657|nr:3D domain-containing protein [Aestuariibaculum marinum]
MKTIVITVAFLLSHPLIPYDIQDNYVWHDLKVTATAYNSLQSQTNSRPQITAFGDSLKPGLKVIAVSNDLYKKGLKYNTPVKIKGLEGIYYVKDKMPARWQNKIDIYMGVDVKAAKAWGWRTITIAYGELIDE